MPGGRWSSLVRALLVVGAVLLATLVPVLRAYAATCGVPVTTSVTLTTDMTCAGDGLVVGKDNIVIDLDGHTVSGGSGVGVLLGGHSGVTIRHGSLESFVTGVDLDGSGNTVEGIVVHSATNGFKVRGQQQTVVGNEADATSGPGFHMSATGSTLARNLARSGQIGIEIDDKACCKVDGNAALDDVTAFEIDSKDVTFTYNSALRSTGAGFVVTKAPTKMAHNIAVDNASDGFYVAGSHKMGAFDGNVADRNGFGDGNPSVGLGFNIAPDLLKEAKGNIASANDNPTNCFPTSVCAYPGSPLPVEAPPPCGSTIDHSFQFSTSKVCDTPGYTITADNITVDLGGHTFGKNMGVGATAFTIDGAKGTTIRNGTIDHFNGAIYAWDSAKDTLVEGIVATRASTAIALSGSGNTAIGNVGSTNAIAFNVFAPPGKTKFLSNVALSNTTDGFAATDDSCCASFVGDVAARNPASLSGNAEGFGLLAKNVVVSHSTALESIGNGFAIDVPTKNETVKSDSAFLNGGDGFNLDGTKKGLELMSDVADLNGFLGGNDDDLGRGFELHSMTGFTAKHDVASMNDNPTECSPQINC